MELVDLHCHLLWGIDDGAKTEEDALEMARVLFRLGFRHVAASPHARPQYADAAACATRREELMGALQREGIALTLHENAENPLDGELLLLAPEQRRTVAGGPYLLAEAPYVATLPQLPELIFRLRVKGIFPLIAHPERCLEFERPGRAQEAVRGGAVLQLDVGALIGRYGRQAKKLARAFLAEGLYGVAATDLHSPTKAEWVEASIEELRALAGDDAVTRLFSDNPLRILRGEPLPERDAP